MRHAWLFVAASALAVACGTPDPVRFHSGHRYLSNEQHYSVDQPDGWKMSLVRGAAMFAPTADARNAKHTIVVRAVDKPGELKEGTPTSSGGLVAATTRVLKSLPQAKVGEPTSAEGNLPGVRWSLTFVPRGLTKPYRREHVLLIGKRVFHVIYTAPAGDPIDEVAFKTMLTTLSEEG